jgi:acetyl-CoA carboxylase carboxyl transferase subunit alpha
MKRYYLDFERKLEPLEHRVEEIKKSHDVKDIQYAKELETLARKIEKVEQEIYGGMSNWQRLQLSRHVNRPHTLDYVEALCTDFVEVHGDRRFRDDPAIVTGFARFNGTRVAIIGHQKGNDLREMASRNFGMVNPEGYRKAQRIMDLANRWHLPLLCFVDTPGAFPGIGAEERGQAEAIASNIYYMFTLSVPVIVIVTGEGMSGGALAIGVGDRILMLEHSIYSVISPEGCIAIIWKGDNSKVPLTADLLKPTAQDLFKLGVIDEVVPEPFGGAHRDRERTFRNVGHARERHLRELSRKPPEELKESRYKKFRAMGVFEEVV